jgi:hypothetical protein
MHMKGILPVGIALILASSGATAAPPPLKCTTSKGEAAADLVVDLNKRVLMWGGIVLTIQAVTDQYITAYELPQDQIGGEIWVLNRTSGDYSRVSLRMSWASMDAVHKGESAELVASKLTGNCSKTGA